LRVDVKGRARAFGLGSNETSGQDSAR
jgi:hypothetical protein